MLPDPAALPAPEPYRAWQIPLVLGLTRDGLESAILSNLPLRDGLEHDRIDGASEHCEILIMELLAQAHRDPLNRNVRLHAYDDRLAIVRTERGPELLTLRRASAALCNAAIAEAVTLSGQSLMPGLSALIARLRDCYTHTGTGIRKRLTVEIRAHLRNEDAYNIAAGVGFASLTVFESPVPED